MTNFEAANNFKPQINDKNPVKRLEDLRALAEQLRFALTKYQNDLGHPDEFINRQISELTRGIECTRLPEFYRVAVVGTFKAGKSSFINEVCGVQSLASVGTNPETATISSFRYASKTTAEIDFIPIAQWLEMAAAYNDDPNSPEARRYKRFYETIENYREKRQKDIELNKKNIPDDIIFEDYLSEYLSDEGKTITIACEDWLSPDSRKKFNNRIKQFVSSRDPLHCLVERVRVYAPINLIKDSVELIDTPGLNDTDVYRVRATENEVDNVDAIIFLTKSGQSYSQSDKDFLIKQIRKRRLKSLKIAITQVDHTYEEAVKQAENDGEEIPTFEEHRHDEMSRVQRSLQETLEEVLNESDLSSDEAQYFVSLLGDIEVFYTSSRWHAESFKGEKGAKYTPADMRSWSGITEIKSALEGIFRNSDMVANAINDITKILQYTKAQVEVYTSQQKSIFNDLSSQKKLEQELQETRQLVLERLRRYAKNANLKIQNAYIRITEDKLSREHIKGRLQVISNYTQDVIDEFEKDDIGRHWKTRREGNLIFLQPFAGRVANRTFAAFESLIREYQKPLLEAAKANETSLLRISEELRDLSKEHELFRYETADLIDSIVSTLKIDPDTLREIIETEQFRIVSEIENFMDDEMQALVSEARMRVAYVEGRGTTLIQNENIRNFYHEFSMIVRPGFHDYLSRQFNHYLQIVSERLTRVHAEINEEIALRLQEQQEMVARMKNESENESINTIANALNNLEQRVSGLFA